MIFFSLKMFLPFLNNKNDYNLNEEKRPISNARNPIIANANRSFNSPHTFDVCSFLYSLRPPLFFDAVASLFLNGLLVVRLLLFRLCCCCCWCVEANESSINVWIPLKKFLALDSVPVCRIYCEKKFMINFTYKSHKYWYRYLDALLCHSWKVFKGF